MTTDTHAEFVDNLYLYGATAEEVIELLDTTDLGDVIDPDALAHERLASLRGVPSIHPASA